MPKGPLPQYARITETGDNIILSCAFCGVKLRGGNAILKIWDSRVANIMNCREERNEHDRIYHLRWWNRH